MIKIRPNLYKYYGVYLYRFGKGHRHWKWAVIKDFETKYEKWLYNQAKSRIEAKEWVDNWMNKLDKIIK